MAGYSAVIDVRVVGQEDIRALTDGVARINQLIKQVKPIPTLFDKRGVAEVVEAKKELGELVKAYADGKVKVAVFSTSIAGINNQLNAFRAIAANAKTGTDEFNNALKAAAISSTRLLDAELARFTSLQQIYTRQEVGAGKGPSKTVRDLLDLQKNVPNSVSALERYQRELLDVQNLVSMTSVEYQELATAIRQVDVALGRGGQFGPAAPPVQGPAPSPNFIPPSRPRGGRGGGGGMPAASGPTSSVNPLQRAADMQENLMLGAGFPLLFGGGAGQVAGGLLGSFVGTGFGGQILGSAIGQQLEDAFKRITEIGKATEMLNMDRLRDSVIVVNAQLDYQVSLLKQAGKADEARALIAKAVFEQTGLTAGATERITSNSNLLGNAWDGVIGAVSGFLSIITSSLVPALLPALKLVELSFKIWNMILSTVQDLVGAAANWVLELAFGKDLAEKIRNFFKGTNEESEKVAVALAKANDEQAKVTKRAQEALAIEKTRTNNVSLMGKLINIEADRRDKINDAENAAADKRKAVLEEFAGVTSAAGKARLAALLQEIEGEKKVAIELANINALRQRQLAQNATLVEQDKVRIALLQMQGEIEKAREDANDKVRAGQIQELEQRKQIALSLNDELSAVNSIYTQKKQGIDAAFAATQREAALKVQVAAADLASVQAQKARGLATDEQVAQARNVYNTAVAVTQETERGAEAVRSAASASADLERRQQTVAAYTKEFATQASVATNALNEQASAIESQAKLTQTVAQAYITINNVKIKSLENDLAATRDVATRAVIIGKIKALEKDNAALTYLSTVAQIKAEVQRQTIAYQLVKVKYQELQATVAIAQAQGLLTREHLNALAAMQSALKIAENMVIATELGAAAQVKAAAAVYEGSLDAADLKAQTMSAAGAAGQFAGNMEYAANSIRKIQKGLVSIRRDGLDSWQEKVIAEARAAAIEFAPKSDPFRQQTAANKAELEVSEYFAQLRAKETETQQLEAKKEFQSKYGVTPFAQGGVVSKPTLAVVGEGGEPEYIIPQSKMAGAVENFLNGKRGQSVIPAFAEGGFVGQNATSGRALLSDDYFRLEAQSARKNPDKYFKNYFMSAEEKVAAAGQDVASIVEKRMALLAKKKKRGEKLSSSQKFDLLKYEYQKRNQGQDLLPDVSNLSVPLPTGGETLGASIGSGPVTINVTTGPTMTFNGEEYVTKRDFVAGLRQVSDSIYDGLRKPSVRAALRLS